MNPRTTLDDVQLDPGLDGAVLTARVSRVRGAGTVRPMDAVDLVVADAELLVTMDDDRRELRGGWVAVDRRAGAAPSAGRPTHRLGAAHDRRARLPRDARLRQHPPPPVPEPHPGLPADDRRRRCSAGCTTLYPLWRRHRRGGRCTSSAWVGLAELALGRAARRRPTTSTSIPAAPATCSSAEIAAAVDLGDALPPDPWLDVAFRRRTAACRPTTWCRTTTTILAESEAAGGPPPRPRRTGRWCASRWRRARRSR